MQYLQDPLPFPVLRSSTTIGRITLKNRLGFGPVNPGVSDYSGRLDEAMSRLYGSLADGELALSYLGGVAVNNRGRSNRTSLVMTTAQAQALLARLISVGESRRMIIPVQLMHSGRQAGSREIGAVPLAASPLPCPYYKEVPTAATKCDIREVVQDFARSARHAASAGCEMIEIHAAHGYFVSGFLSRNTNYRSDQYGGTLRNRFRVLGEIVQAIRSNVDVTLGARVNVFEQGSGGLQVEELVDGLGSIGPELDFVSITGGMYSVDDDMIIPRRLKGPGIWRRQSRYVRSQLNIPTLIAGNIETAAMADEIVAVGDADITLMVRSLLADPMLYAKSQQHNAGSVQRCTELYLCKYHSRGASHVYCPHSDLMRNEFRPTVNPVLARRKSKDR
ncbi:hypothetical protein [Nocardia sp. CA-135398]|uniref:oxidoreductase n=1 Tax=Nocardia sp. CA-135398 TaxID=3239977 RepID=UPI003D99C73F